MKYFIYSFFLFCALVSCQNKEAQKEAPVVEKPPVESSHTRPFFYGHREDPNSYSIFVFQFQDREEHTVISSEEYGSARYVEKDKVFRSDIVFPPGRFIVSIPKRNVPVSSQVMQFQEIDIPKNGEDSELLPNWEEQKELLKDEITSQSKVSVWKDFVYVHKGPSVKVIRGKKTVLTYMKGTGEATLKSGRIFTTDDITVYRFIVTQRDVRESANDNAYTDTDITLIQSDEGLSRWQESNFESGGH